MSEDPPPKLSDTSSPTIRNMFALFGRGLIYAVAFWTVYRAMLFIYPPSGSSTDSDEKLRQGQITQMNMYDQQARRANQVLDESESQQTRMRAVISKQEEQAKRFDAIFDRWEKQGGVRK